jgi:YVTN family beta-propeller protein
MRYYGPKLLPIEDPSNPIEFQGFSILPPQEGEWKLVRNWYNAMLAKDTVKTKKGSHTFIAMVQTSTIEEDFEKKEVFLQHVKENFLEKGLLSRYRIISTDLKFHDIEDALCVRYDQLLEDRGVPGSRGSVFMMELHGVTCRHPDNPKMIINLGYSQRTPPGVKRVPLEEEGEPFLSSLSFTPLKRPFVTSMIDVGESPQLIASGHGSIWVAVRNNNSVVRIDSEKNKVIATIPVGREPCGVLSTKESVWVSNLKDRTISRIDPESNKIIATIKTGKWPISIAAGFGSIWVVNENSNTVSRINKETNKVDATIKVGNSPLGIAIGNDAVWVGNRREPRVSRIDPQANRVAGKRIYAGSGPIDLLFWKGSVWVATCYDNRVVRINPKTDTVMDRIPVGRGPGSLVAAEGMLWVANCGDNTVMRINPESAEVLGESIPVGAVPSSMQYYNDALWISIMGEGRVYRIDL